MRGLLAAMPGSSENWTIVDMEAGLEHLSRSEGTLRYVDHLVVVIEPYAKAIETARRTIPLAAELGIPRTSAVANKVRDAGELSIVERFCSDIGTELIGVLPYDESVRAADRDGVAPIDHSPRSALVRAVEDLVLVLEKVPGPRPDVSGDRERDTSR